MSRKVQPTYTPEEVKAAFKVFETPNSGLPAGHVKTSALERALTTYGTEKLTLEEAQDLLSQVSARYQDAPSLSQCTKAVPPRSAPLTSASAVAGVKKSA